MLDLERSTHPFFSLLPHLRVVSSAQAVLATGSGIAVIRSCKNVVSDR